MTADCLPFITQSLLLCWYSCKISCVPRGTRLSFRVSAAEPFLPSTVADVCARDCGCSSCDNNLALPSFFVSDLVVVRFVLVGRRTVFFIGCEILCSDFWPRSLSWGKSVCFERASFQKQVVSVCHGSNPELAQLFTRRRKRKNVIVIVGVPGKSGTNRFAGVFGANCSSESMLEGKNLLKLD